MTKQKEPVPAVGSIYTLPGFGTKVSLGDIYAVQPFRFNDNAAWFSVLFHGNKHYTTFDVMKPQSNVPGSVWNKLKSDAEASYLSLIAAWEHYKAHHPKR